MRTLTVPVLTTFLLGLLAVGLLRPGPTRAWAGDPPPKAGEGKPGDAKPGEAKPGEVKPGDAKPGDGDDDPDDFFGGETSFSKEAVDKAINKGVDWLRKKQRSDGSWGELSGGQAYGGGGQGGGYGHPAGCTGLALYALLKCKVNPKDPVITRGFKYLKESGNDLPGSSYETSIVLLAVTSTADQSKATKASEKAVERVKLSGEMRGWAQKLVNELLEKRQSKGGWRYNLPPKLNPAAPPGGDEDLSSTQLAALALFAAHRAGIRVKDAIWEDMIKYALGNQDEDGEAFEYTNPKTNQKMATKARGFCYIKGQSDPEEGQAVGSMTACGVGTLMTARYILSDAGRKKELWDKRPDAAKIQSAINDGVAWLIQNWSSYDNPKKSRTNVYTIYWLYSFERMMDLIGWYKMGNHLWYNEMGQELLNKQAENGHWKSGTTLEPQDTLDTCFALLFLKRSTKGAIPLPDITGGSDGEAPADNR